MNKALDWSKLPLELDGNKTWLDYAEYRRMAWCGYGGYDKMADDLYEKLIAKENAENLQNKAERK